MGFTSQLFPGEKIINDSTPEHATQPPPGQGRGLVPAEFRHPARYADFDAAIDFPSDLLIPESEWQARIQEMEERKTRTSDVIDQAGLPCKNQSQTNYCWINAPTHCVECERVIQNQDMVILSPASAGAQIKNYRNDGGWGREGLEFIVQYGLVPVDKWPANAIDRKYATPENKAIALNYRAVEWMVCNTKAQFISSLLRRHPGASGLNWWSHEITYYDVVWLDGTAAVRFRNSWGMEYGSRGYSILQGSKMLPDDYVCVRTALPS